MNEQWKKDELQLRRIFEDLVTSGLTGDLDRFVSYFEEPYTGVGMGEQGLIHSVEEMERIMRTGYQPMDKVTIDIEFQDFAVSFMNADAAAVSGAVTIKNTLEDGEVMYSGIMQSFVFRRHEGAWKVGFTHASSMMLSEESIKAYPIKFADYTLSQLKAELQTDMFDMINKSFSGGIFGTYAREAFPLYFANDRFIEMMGYEREEFEEKFRDDTTLFNYTDDKLSMEQKSRQAYNSDSDYIITTRFIRKDGSFIWVELQDRKTTDSEGNEIFLVIVTDITELVNLQLETQKQHDTILQSLDYASKIQRNLLSRKEVFDKAFSDYSVLWKPRDIVGGDIYWLKNFNEGSVLCVCDCTGHGTPGAMLTMLVSSTFDTLVNETNCSDTAAIMYGLENRLVSALNVDAFGSVNRRKNSMLHFNDGCDLAVLFIAKNGTVTLSTANMPVFICDGADIRHIKGQKLHIGDGRITSKEDVLTITVPYNPDNVFYIASDGLYDQVGAEGGKFGYRTFKSIILQHHAEKQSVISGKIWEAFETCRKEESRRDDVELITFKPAAI